MPEYGKPTGRDILTLFESRIHDLERQVSSLTGRILLSVDRGTTSTVSAPVEGQLMVAEDTENLNWYSNGSWRRAVAAIPISGLSWGYIADDGTNFTVESFPALPPFQFSQVITNHATGTVAPDQSDIATVNMSLWGGGTCAGLKLQSSGLYLIHARARWSDWTSTAGVKQYLAVDASDNSTGPSVNEIGNADHDGGVVTRVLLMWAYPTYGGQSGLYLKPYQNSGSSRTITSSSLAVVGPLFTLGSGTPTYLG